MSANVDAILRQHDRFARSLAHKYAGWIFPEHMDDFVQVALVAIAKAARDHEAAGKPGLFINWAFTAGRSAVLVERRRVERRGFVVKAAPGSAKHWPRPLYPLTPSGATPLTNAARGPGESKGDLVPEALKHDPWQALEDGEQEALLAQRLVAAVDRLPPRWREVVQAKIDGEPFTAVAARWGVSHQRVSQVFAEARARVLAEVST